MGNRGHQLTTIGVPDSLDAWQSAGFATTEGGVRMGSLTVQPESSGSVPSWGFEAALDREDVDGIPILNADVLDATGKTSDPEPSHRNGVIGVDHVVVVSPDLGRTTAAFESAGLSHRRTRAVPGTEREQRFFWAGDIIIEMVGPREPVGNEPASIWGLALVVGDIEEAARRMGDLVTKPKPAVQKGRSICAIRTKNLGLSVTLALMSPHVVP